MSAAVASPVVFVDFDGTITARDTTDAILEAFGDDRWRDLEESWLAGDIGSRECLRGQMALVDASSRELDALIDGIAVDEGFALLLDTCAALRVPLHIVSDGFDYCIGRVLSRPSLRLDSRLRGVQIVSSRLEPDGRRWRASFVGPTCSHGCATCKPATMARLALERGAVVYVGDGFSDRHAAAAADIVFAKGSLAAYCEERSIPYIAFQGLATVAHELGQLVQAAGAVERMRLVP
jgi:2-hydroxy-3-keto-5-methylthiopentenyl-1-phosphate phosphatase